MLEKIKELIDEQLGTIIFYRNDEAEKYVIKMKSDGSGVDVIMPKCETLDNAKKIFLRNKENLLQRKAISDKKQKGKLSGAAFALTLFLGIIGLIVALVLANNKNPMEKKMWHKGIVAGLIAWLFFTIIITVMIISFYSSQPAPTYQNYYYGY